MHAQKGESNMGFFSKLFGKPQVKLTETESKSVNKLNRNLANDNVPPVQGDYAKTIFLWANEKASPIKKSSEYARYFLYECGIRDCAAYHRELITAGYFEEASIELLLDSLKISELKQILTDINQPTTGKKDALISRILTASDTSIISKYCPQKLYVLTEKGTEFLSAHNDYVQIHKHKNWGVSWQEYDAKHREGHSFFDTIWGILNERIVRDNKQFGRNEYLFMYQLLLEENRRKDALEMLLRVLYIDLSGVAGLDSFSLYKKGLYKEKELREQFDIIIMLAPGIINPIADYRDVFEDSIVDHIYEHKLPIQVCDKKLFLSIVYKALDGSYEETIIKEQLRKAYSKAIKEI